MWDVTLKAFRRAGSALSVKFSTMRICLTYTGAVSHVCLVYAIILILFLVQPRLSSESLYLKWCQYDPGSICCRAPWKCQTTQMVWNRAPTFDWFRFILCYGGHLIKIICLGERQISMLRLFEDMDTWMSLKSEFNRCVPQLGGSSEECPSFIASFFWKLPYLSIESLVSRCQ